MKSRLDKVLFEIGLAESREKAQRLIMAGLVTVDGKRADKTGAQVSSDAHISVGKTSQYVGRGAEKLAGAAAAFHLDFTNKIIADIGSSTGGFTDYVLQHGAKKVYAIDVGTGQLDWRLRNDTRVVVMEQTHIKDVRSLPELVDMFLVDVSFISLKNVLPTIKGIAKHYTLNTRPCIVALYKPQFEAGRKIADKTKGVIKDPIIHEELLRQFREWCVDNNFIVQGECASPITGDKGNREFFFHLTTNTTNYK